MTDVSPGPSLRGRSFSLEPLEAPGLWKRSSLLQRRASRALWLVPASPERKQRHRVEYFLNLRGGADDLEFVGALWFVVEFLLMKRLLESLHLLREPGDVHTCTERPTCDRIAQDGL